MLVKLARCQAAGAIGNYLEQLMNTIANLRWNRGFALIESLVALLIVAFAALAISQIATLVLSSAGDAKARAQALTLAQAAIERARNSLTVNQFTAHTSSTTTESAGSGANVQDYTITTSVTTPSGGMQQRDINATVSWTTSAGQTQQVTLNSRFSWDNADQQADVNAAITTSAITPRGAARRGTSDMTHATQPTTKISTNSDGTKIHQNDNQQRTELLASDGRTVILYLNYVNGVAQSFTTISGKIILDSSINNLPDADTFAVRLSSEGECIYNNNTTTAISSGGFSYTYFPYTCYMGSGWYGNVGITSSDNNANYVGCVGDPGYNGGYNTEGSNGSLTSPHDQQTNARAYRGFEQVGASFLSTGMETGSSYPSAIRGYPKPSGLNYANVSAGGTDDLFNQDFLITRLNQNQSCSSKMDTTTFWRNAGAYYCITPDSSSATDQCPSIWPNFEGFVSGGGGGGGGGSTCTTNISGSGAYYQGNPQLAVSLQGGGTLSSAGTCSVSNGGGYSCNAVLTSAAGTIIRITSSRSNPNANPAKTVDVTVNCGAMTGQNFP